VCYGHITWLPFARLRAAFTLVCVYELAGRAFTRASAYPPPLTTCHIPIMTSMNGLLTRGARMGARRARYRTLLIAYFRIACTRPTLPTVTRPVHTTHFLAMPRRRPHHCNQFVLPTWRIYRT